MDQSVYQENGYNSRDEYLRDLADDYDLPLVVVLSLAKMLGETEDFDGLVNACQDAAGYELG